MKIPHPAAPYLAAARKASEAVSAFIDAGPDGTEDWRDRRGDVAMDAAHALYSLLRVIDFPPAELPRLAAVRAVVDRVLSSEQAARQLALEEIARIVSPDREL